MEAWLVDAFRKFDLDKEGKIDLQELQMMLRAVNYTPLYGRLLNEDALKVPPSPPAPQTQTRRHTHARARAHTRKPELPSNSLGSTRTALARSVIFSGAHMLFA